ncbi:type IV pilus twitching motility protein PilT [Nocardioides sp. MAHUQ-72]|uniref:type IV pilus twitching motility protein PilT n=1 Tax=unclassified Nocardioides TaxID=2615069 RepID=UPI00361D73A3
MNEVLKNGFGLSFAGTTAPAAPAPAPAAPAAAPAAAPVAAPVAAPAQTAPQPVQHAQPQQPAYAPQTPAAHPSPAGAPGQRGLVLDDLLIQVLRMKGSDLHLTSNAPPTVRVRGEMEAIEGFPPLDGEQLRSVMYGVMTERQRKVFEEELELDFAYAVPGHARFRVNVFQQREALGAVMRVIPWEIVPLEDLGMPEVLGTFAGLPRGLVLVTGPTGSGKSTTLAAIIDKINRSRRGHIMTIEDPIEFLHEHRGCLVNQREVGGDTHGFRAALKHALRQDPDVILVGELRDLETISVALTAAETGHLVLATLHTQSAQDTITRVVDVFPSDQQQQVRTQLAATLQGVVCQTLVKTADGQGRAAAVEVMVCNTGIRAMIRDDKLQQIQGALQAGAKDGMQTLNAHLAALVRAGRITYAAGLEACTNRADFDTLAGSSVQRAAPSWQ